VGDITSGIHDRDMGRTIRVVQPTRSGRTVHGTGRHAPQGLDTCTATLLEDILKIEIDLIGYVRYGIPYNDYHATD
jgi:hypothetical protein